MCGVDELLRDDDLFVLETHLRGQLCEFRFPVRYCGGEAILFGTGASILGTDLAGQAHLLDRQTLQHGCINIQPVGRYLGGVDGEEDVTFADQLVFGNMDLGHGALLRNEYFRCSRGRCEIARDGLFARVARNANEDDDRADRYHEQPGKSLERGGLKASDLAKVPILFLEFEGFGTKEGACHGSHLAVEAGRFRGTRQRSPDETLGQSLLILNP